MRGSLVFATMLAFGVCSSLGVLGMRFANETAAAGLPLLEASASPAAVATAGDTIPAVVTEATPASTVAPAIEAPPVVPEQETTPAPSATPVPFPVASDRAAQLLDLMNEARAAESLPPLTADVTLEGVALARARSLVGLDYFAHYAPDGSSAFSELASLGVAYGLAGENLARNNYPDGRTVQVAFDGLMASPSHRANILEPRFTRAGVIATHAGSMWLYVTVFMD